MWSDYRGGKPACEMGPPAKTPSATIRPQGSGPAGHIIIRESMVRALADAYAERARKAFALDLGLPRLTPEEVADRTSARDAARDRVDGWLDRAIGGSTRAVIDLHKRTEFGDCAGCDPGAHAESDARWPCSTIYAIAPFVGISEDDLNLLWE